MINTSLGRAGSRGGLANEAVGNHIYTRTQLIPTCESLHVFETFLNDQDITWRIRENQTLAIHAAVGTECPAFLDLTTPPCSIVFPTSNLERSNLSRYAVCLQFGLYYSLLLGETNFSTSAN